MPTLYQMLSGGMTREEHREKSMLEIAKKRRDAKVQGKPVLDVHAGLDLLGMTPGVGAPADLLNAALYAAKGEKSQTLMSLAQAVPLVGLGAAVKKLTRPSNQIRAASGYTDAFQKWWDNLNDYSRQNPGSVDWDRVQKDVTETTMNRNSQGYYEFIKDYSKEHFGGYVTVPKAAVAGKSKRKALKEARTPDKQKKETLQAKLREKELQEIRHDEFKRGTGYQAVTKRSEY
tara:strand:- start:25 stop:717 length:693 start_codon:yes stop_codon:yes gene_type:complete